MNTRLGGTDAAQLLPARLALAGSPGRWHVTPLLI